jgi:hypothetical protein
LGWKLNWKFCDELLKPIHALFRWSTLETCNNPSLEAQLNALSTFGLAIIMGAASASILPADKKLVLVQAVDCYTVGEQQAAEQGGALATASDAVQNGQPVCRVIVVVPGQNGERPKRVEIIVPKG